MNADPDFVALFEVTRIGLALFILYWVVFREHNRFEALICATACVLGLGLELAGTYAGAYYYDPQFSGFLFGAPLTIGVGWGLVIYTTRRLAGRLDAAWWKVPGIAGLLAVAFDLFLDPTVASAHIAVGGGACPAAPHFPGADGAGLWVWCLQDYHLGNETFGVPIFNYITWFLMVCYFTLAYRAVAQRRYESLSAAGWRKQLEACGAVLVIATVLLVITLGIVVKFLEWTGIPHIYVLGFMVGLASLSLISVGKRRTTEAFDLSACMLLFVNTAVILYGFYVSDAIPGSAELESWFWHTNLLCWALVIWCMSGRVPARREVGYVLDWRGAERMDPPADALVADIYDGAGGVDDANALMHQLMAARDLSDIEDAHPRLGEFARSIATQSSDFNAQRVARGQAVFLKHVPINVAALCIASLPEAYLMERSGAVLGRTRRLKYPQAVRRVIETAQFVLHVVEEGGLDPCDAAGAHFGRGRIAILRVRLMHAAIRYLILNPRPAAADDPTDEQLYHVDPVRSAWTHDGETYDWAPINQLEMLFTLHCFCWVTLRAMRQSGMTVSQQDAEDYVYFWNVVGRLMGIEPSLLPATPDEAERSFEVIKAAGRGASADGRALTKSAMRVMARMIRDKTPLGRWDMRITRAYMEDFLDDSTLEQLGLRVVPLWSNLAPLLFVRLLNAFMGMMDWLGEPFPFLQRVNAKIGVRMLGFYTKHQSDQDLAFYLPQSLKNRAG